MGGKAGIRQVPQGRAVLVALGGDGGENFPRNADLRQFRLAAQLPPRQQPVAGFAPEEGDGEARAEGRAPDLPRGPIQPRGYINGDDREAARGDRIDQFRDGAGNVAGKTCAENAVHDQPGIPNGFRLQPLALRQPHRPARFLQAAVNDAGVSAIIARSCQNQRWAGGEAAENRIRDGLPCPLHKHGFRHAARNGELIGLGHFGGSEQCEIGFVHGFQPNAVGPFMSLIKK